MSMALFKKKQRADPEAEKLKSFLDLLAPADRAETEARAERLQRRWRKAGSSTTRRSATA